MSNHDATSKESKSRETSTALATFAGGCFWCMEPPFEKIPGVLNVVAGYSGGEEHHPTYDQVSSGQTGHLEAIQITYDPRLVEYSRLLEIFWENIDPTDAGGQFADRGKHYRTAIFFHDSDQKLQAEESLKRLESAEQLSGAIATKIVGYQNFYPAEEYHQDYHKKNPLRYELYKKGSGRADYLEKKSDKK